jgi:hypothetical protein
VVRRPTDVEPTISRIAEHARDTLATDLNCPIITTLSGDVLEAAHRMARAYLQGLPTITTVQARAKFVVLPVPDRRCN